MKPRFLLDENVALAIRDHLIQLDDRIIIKAVGDLDSPPKGTKDPDLLLWIEKNNFILVTGNRRSMPTHLKQHYDAGGEIPGLLFLRPGFMVKNIVEELYLIWGTAAQEEFRNQIFYIPWT